MIDDRILGDIEETLKDNTKIWPYLGDQKKKRGNLKVFEHLKVF